MKKILILAMCIFCTLPCFATTSTTISNCNGKELQNILIKRAVKYGNQVQNITENSFTLKTPLGFWGQVFHTPSNMSGTAKTQADFVIIQDGKDVIISVTGNIISNDTSMTRYSYPIGFKYENEILQGIKKRVEGYYTYNFTFKMKKKYILVIEKIDYSKETPLLSKDKIIKIDGVDFNEYWHALSDSKEKKEPIKVEIMRKNYKTKKKEIIERTLQPYYIKPYEELL